jgi:hypothetical protein
VQQLELEGDEHRRASLLVTSGVRSRACGGRVEQVQEVAQQVVERLARLVLLGEPRDEVERRGSDLLCAPAAAQVLVCGLDLDPAHDRQVAASLDELRAHGQERFEPHAEPAARLARALGDHASTTTVPGVQVRDEVRLAVAKRAQYDRLDAISHEDRLPAPVASLAGDGREQRVQLGPLARVE